MSKFCLSRFCLVEILSCKGFVSVEILSHCRDFVRVEILTVEVLSVEVLSVEVLS